MFCVCEHDTFTQRRLNVLISSDILSAISSHDDLNLHCSLSSLLYLLAYTTVHDLLESVPGHSAGAIRSRTEGPKRGFCTFEGGWRCSPWQGD